MLRYVWFALLVCAPAFGQSVGDLDFSQGYTLRAVPLGFGGAYRALADSNAAIHLNPAGLAQRKGVLAASGDYIHHNNGGSDGNAFGVSIADYKATEILALAASYDRDQATLAGSGVTAQQFTLAGAKDFAEVVYVGAAVKYYNSDVDSPFVSGPDGGDLDIGLLAKPFPMLSLALTGTNLIQGTKYAEFPLQLGFGTALTLPPHARFAIDVVKDFETPPTNNDLNAYFGGELRAAEGMFLRGGFGLDRIRDNNFWSVAAVLAGPKIAINFDYTRSLSPAGNTFAANIEGYF